MRRCEVVRRLIAPVLILSALLSSSASLQAQEITGEQVRQAIARAIEYLKATQRADGRWPEAYQEGGITAIATLALLNAGVPANDPALRRAIEMVRALHNQYVYTTALKIQVLAAADPVRFRREIAAAADWLRSAQLPNGMWTYNQTPGMGTGDFSNTQFALLGLHEAGRAGAQIPNNVWRNAERAWIQSQLADGGWGYVPNTSARGSMTAAGIASLYITGHSLSARRRAGVGADGRIICCASHIDSMPILRGLAGMAAHFSVKNTPGGSWYYYYMYAVERVGILSGKRFIGNHDWYREGAAQLLHRQRPDGSWHETHTIVDTAFALLFLAKGHRPVLFHKLQWSRDGRWNLTRDDLNHLTAFIADRLGDPPTWEVAQPDESLERWLAAPIMYFNGADFPPFNQRQTDQLREFVKQGGTLLVVASCGGDKFRQGFQRWVKTAFPEYELRKLPADHPVFRSLFQVNPAPYDLHGIDVGCRTSIFFCPHDLACLWEFPNIPNQSRPALELGANLAAYATGLEPLPDRLDTVRLVQAQPEAEEQTVPRGTLVIAQLMHNGDWRPDPHVVPKLAKHLHEKMGVDVLGRVEPLKATDPRLKEHPVIFMTGHFSFELTPEEIAALGEHIRRGGFLFAEACCGREAFDLSFRKMIGELFPDTPLKPLPPEHPIIAGSPGTPVPKVAYRPAVVAEQPNLHTVRLEGIHWEGRTAVVYSPFAIGCGVDGHQCYACRGLVNEDAMKLAGNIVLYALSY